MVWNLIGNVDECNLMMFSILNLFQLNLSFVILKQNNVANLIFLLSNCLINCLLLLKLLLILVDLFVKVVERFDAFCAVLAYENIFAAELKKVFDKNKFVVIVLNRKSYLEIQMLKNLVPEVAINSEILVCLVEAKSTEERHIKVAKPKVFFRKFILFLLTVELRLVYLRFDCTKSVCTFVDDLNFLNKQH